MSFYSKLPTNWTFLLWLHFNFMTWTETFRNLTKYAGNKNLWIQVNKNPQNQNAKKKWAQTLNQKKPSLFFSYRFLYFTVDLLPDEGLLKVSKTLFTAKVTGYLQIKIQMLTHKFFLEVCPAFLMEDAYTTWGNCFWFFGYVFNPIFFNTEMPFLEAF